MDSKIQNLCEDLFAAAIELPVDQREAFIRAETETDGHLQQELIKLLSWHDESPSTGFILDRPIRNLSLDSESIANIGEKVGDTIGQYRLLEKIGEGGMGVVYMAEQLHNVRRKVALKIIKLGMDTRQVVARFEVERQAMALFDHPNIARVLDAGSTDNGRPYFVMELVRGSYISDFVDKRQLSLEHRLELFNSVCKAVHHAHQKGIIHRDLKPSNILVTQYDGIAVPKVIDFGIAKAIGQRLTDKTLFTRYSAMVGTPQYMSPEQAEMTGIDVDTRSDIYSLGVLLYELLTGSTPLRKEDVKKLNPLALSEMLRDTEIEAPSSRYSRTRLENPELDLGAELPNRVKSELDWIVMKSLARDRTRRYASAHELAADVKRFLDGDPVLAAPPSKSYKLRAYAYKHRVGVLTAMLVTTALLCSTIISSIFAFKANRLNGELTTAISQATENLNRAEIAEGEVRRNNEAKLYHIAQLVAFDKFTDSFCTEVIGGLESLIDKGLPFTTLAGKEIEIDDYSLGGVCLYFESDDLLDIQDAKLLELQLDRIRDSLRQEKLITDELALHFSPEFAGKDIEDLESMFADDEFGGHGELCHEVRKLNQSKMPQFRVMFFRSLVDEYRRTMGDNDSRVCSGLLLLSAALIDAKELDEAESRLRESIALKSRKGIELEQKLLTKIDRIRRK